MSSFAEIAEVFYSTIEERDDYDARLRLIAVPGVSRLEKKRRAAYASRSRSRAYRCGACGEFGHNRRACLVEVERGCMRGTWEEHLEAVKAFFNDLRYVAKRGRWTLDGPDYRVEAQPPNPRIDRPGTRTIAVRLHPDDGPHLVGLIELTYIAQCVDALGPRIAFATKTEREICERAVARLREAFG